MASAQLTDRQKQIKDMIEEGKSVPDIAKALGITTNAVYQNRRRMRDGKKSGAKKSTTAKPAAPKPSTAPSDTSADLRPTARPITPLQSIRNRRDEINAEIKAARAEQEAAQRALAKAEESAQKVADRYGVELANLDAAEAALKGTAAPPKAKTQAKSGKGAQASTPRPKAADKNTAKNGNGTQPATAATDEAKAAAQPTPPPESPEPAKPGPVAVG